MTIKQATFELRQVGVTLRKKDGEYRVNVKGASELHAYYTDDLADAVATGKRFTLRTSDALPGTAKTAQTFVDRINPRRFNFSPKFVALVGAIIGYDYGVRDGRGNQVSSFSITSDGFVISSSNAFLGSADDLARNLQDFFTVIHPADKEHVTALYASRVKDWRL